MFAIVGKGKPLTLHTCQPSWGITGEGEPLARVHSTPLGEGEALTLWSLIAPRSTPSPQELPELYVQLKRDPHRRVVP